MLSFILLSSIKLTSYELINSANNIYDQNIITLNDNIASHQLQLVHFPVNPQNTAFKRISYNEQTALYLEAINRAQQAYFFETRKFADRHTTLNLGFPKENKYYQIITRSKDRFAVSYGIPITESAKYRKWNGSSWSDAQEPLYSYVSKINYSSDLGYFQAILCVSDKVGISKLETPKIIDNRLICPLDTTEIP